MNVPKITAAIALGLAAFSAAADDQSILLTQTAPGLYTGSFSETHQLSGPIFDSFTFSLPDNLAAIGSGALSFTSLSSSASLILASLTSANGNMVGSPPDADNIAVPSMLTFTGFTAPLTLAVVGAAGDAFAEPGRLTTSYGGQISFSTAVAAVPEPQVYASMLAGLALVGLALGGRNSRISRRRS